MRVRFLASVLVAVAGSGCGLGIPGLGGGVDGGGGGTGGGSGGAARFGDGSRLKVRAWTAEGLTGFLGFTDTQLGAPCTFRVASDGELRCLPGAATTAVGNTFLDAACTQRALLLAACATVPAEVGLSDATVCPAREHRYPVGAAVSPTTLYQVTPSGCLGYSFPSGSVAHPLGAEFPASRYVKGTVEAPSVSSGVGLKVTRAEDGAWQYSGLRDVSQDFEALTAKLEDGAWHAVPQNVVAGAGDLFADATCTGLAVTRAPSVCAAPPWVSQTATVACEDRRTFAHLGAALSGAYRRADSQCIAADLFTLTAYAVGAPAAASTFVTPTVTPEGSGRLHRDRLSWPGGAVTFGPLSDATLGTTCQPLALAGDARLFCVPYGASAQSAGFSDPGCTQPLVGAGPGDCAPRFAQLVEPQACGARLRYFTVGAAFTGSVYTGTPAACSAAPPSTGQRWFVRGAELTGADLVELPLMP